MTENYNNQSDWQVPTIDQTNNRMPEELKEDVRCPNCNGLLFKRDLYGGVILKEQVYAHLQRNVQKCPQCGFDLLHHDFFNNASINKQFRQEKCQNCGGAIVIDPATGKKVCAQCGSEYMAQESTEKETDKKCPNCGATVIYDPALGKMHCEFCGYQCELPNADAGSSVVELDFESAINTESCNWGAEKKTVECKSCGAVTIYDALQTSAVCPFCGSTSVMPSATENTLAPGGVCPFTITKEKAGESFTTWLKKKWFTPRKAKKNASPEAFNGMYLPYWTYDAQTTSNFNARAGYDRRVRQKDGNYTTETTWRYVSGVYQEFIDDETVVASKRHADSGVKECEPFQLSKVIPYTPQALAGFVAERYSIGLKEGWGIAQSYIQTKLKDHINSYVKNHWRCDRVSSVKFSTIYSNITYKYIMVPVWMSSFKYKEKTYQFVVNGQTGKVGGKAPVSAFRVILAVLIGIGIIAGLYFLLS